MEEFKNDLLATYQAIVDIIKYRGISGIVNQKRQETYIGAIEIVKEQQADSMFIQRLESLLTLKPSKIMKDLFKDGQVTMENKEPYNGVTIRYGEIISPTENIQAFRNLSILLGIGIGIGPESVKNLIQLGYSTIDELKEIYERDKFADFRKGLQGPLIKYFEGMHRTIKMTREDASKWAKILEDIVNDIVKGDVNITHSMAGSYARGKEEIGDIDYLIVVNGPDSGNKLYEIMNCLLDRLSTKLENVQEILETPSLPPKDKNKRYSTSIKMWFKNATGGSGTKVEIYGYSNAKFMFPFFARAGDVRQQKDVKFQAIKAGYKLGPWSLDKDDIDVENYPELIRKKIGKDKFENIYDLFEFVIS